MTTAVADASGTPFRHRSFAGLAAIAGNMSSIAGIEGDLL
jgi:hypothetical protein